MTMWSFPEMGTPQKSSKLDNFFLLKPIGFGDPPIVFTWVIKCPPLNITQPLGL